MRIPLPATLFGKTALTIAVVLVLFQVFTTLVIAYYLLIPVARRSANDLADFMLLSSRVWATLPVSDRAEFQEVLREESGLILSPANDNLPRSTVYLPYVLFLGKVLAEHTQRPIQMKVEQKDGVDWYWVDFYSEGQRLRVGFSGQRIDIHAPLAIFLILLLGTTLTLVTTLIMVRRLTRPLSQLSDAAERIGRGGIPEPLPEIGPSELVNLVRTFNKMAHQVKALLASRTTLLAGIAHDLRTPIARMRLALEVLPPSADPELLERMLRGLDNMTRLVNQSLEFGRGAGHDLSQEVDVAELIEELTEEAKRGGAEIHLQPSRTCVRFVSPMALRRILTNLLDNAVRYREDRPSILPVYAKVRG
ncbi:histidine kinase dimerization/phospho-acceptor domain-containing protein [Sulfuricella sp.]|uniref:histidine kinase dimerization/phospho-acceptor domain-containing protein n=1 Tax=Sulfuricella sp. TaxID=2099377 RepID=UPI002D0F351A|nr:histidine kinase dimerization/phospho-acceptor domain-containing protein [Sulfuricella sp.]HUX62304.1 histidine kinase dimerization/phospho-acceptor domain-containing protein [Sulfuricella sp.]